MSLCVLLWSCAGWAACGPCASVLECCLEAHGTELDPHLGQIVSREAAICVFASEQPRPPVHAALDLEAAQWVIEAEPRIVCEEGALACRQLTTYLIPVDPGEDTFWRVEEDQLLASCPGDALP